MAVRLAKASDLAATSRIASRGFSLSPWNAFYRLFATAYPQDVEKSYLREQQEALGDQNKLFTVVELQAEAQDAKQVVGFVIWSYAQQQERKSDTAAIDLADEKGSWPHPIADRHHSLTEPDRSVDPYRASILFSATESAVQKYLGGHMELDNMAVDPDHFRKGYGTLLCRHGMEITREDNIPVGVIAAELGMKLYESLGCACTAKVSLTDGRPGEDASVDFLVQEWNSKDN
ncbi:GNAT family acetyltransferase [Fusarium agapanthi]|uniref:GNAT family acetyltransferase n=1 Tax=Fusarium agapanthi TaxID=1803897 RepID=A0A9P5B6L1_9HYPO|nr:GNAT family acetyltransferase [Fusarium agapanthi]